MILGKVECMDTFYNKYIHMINNDKYMCYRNVVPETKK